MPTKDNIKIEKVYFRIKERNIFKRFFQWLFKKNKWQEIELPIKEIGVFESEVEDDD